MRYVKPYYAAFLLLAIVSCGKRTDYKHASVQMEAATAADDANADSVMPLQSADRKMVRTATIRARVNNLQSVTSQLENLAGSVGGIVAESNLQNEVVQENEYAYGPDSIRKVQVYVPTAHLELRVPVLYLDSVLRRVGELSVFTNSRVLKQEDLTFQYLSNNLKIKAANQQLAQPVVGAQHQHGIDAAQYTSKKQEDKIDRTVQNQVFNDQVAYATLQVTLFQGQLADVQVVVNPEVVTRAGFVAEMGIALRNSAALLREIILFLISYWPFVFIGILAWNIFRRRRRVGKTIVKA
ncbi:protein of unknown function [Chitinophaga costaii]|uniref:DUF4349 domain-containing protein n=1 Tax=Chitinophaga costaii TaxID=1335309 RepID=A0A1C3YYY5_9BACT|nr:DUF4349 domain-containing protein [Chitinophaga costaii]SCB75311.1 protein of unknown function [Chitinophaga costaii]